ncbi:MAG: NAD-dependent epimerase/dehydratase family protein [Desulfobacteraceae bacterium]|nr:MAG: NAD-dependent epimerase/dehydratase family protein [Desulfobacteraceae bacterium]
MKKTVLVTGGAGFIGSNLVADLLKQPDYQVIVFDNLSRNGTRHNLEWLGKKGDFKFIQGDVRNSQDIGSLFKDNEIQAVLHLAAQVAVTYSVLDPREDFEINALGTFNLLEAVRASGQKPLIIYTSTNKVYGAMEDVDVVEEDGAYIFRHERSGISEERALDFHSPYGCSKGTADQYVRDYFRIYGIPSVVFRQSCIYGYRQFGVEDQGWVAWFMIAAQLKKKITVYGDGKQVRDILFVDDLVSLFNTAINDSGKASGKIYNIGGGPRNRLSIRELIQWLKMEKNLKVDHDFADWRPGDQPVYISNIHKVKQDLGWKPRVSKAEGLEKLYQWIAENLDEIGQVLNR